MELEELAESSIVLHVTLQSWPESPWIADDGEGIIVAAADAWQNPEPYWGDAYEV